MEHLTIIFLVFFGIMFLVFAVVDTICINIGERKRKEYFASLPKPKIRVWSPDNDFLDHE